MDQAQVIVDLGIHIDIIRIWFLQKAQRLFIKGNGRRIIIGQVPGNAQAFVSTGKGRVLDVVPGELHQRVPLIIGSTEDVKTFERFVSED